MKKAVQSFYGNRLRVRVCGLCVHQEKLLLVNHEGLGAKNLWIPPGGGLNFGETAEACIKREFIEETGLEVRVNRFLFACEFIRSPLHAVELFFEVTPLTFGLKKGQDPELGSPSLIKAVNFFSWEEIGAISTAELHGIFAKVSNPQQLLNLHGFFSL
ncbi:MAG: NUDIX hydrolase [Bacteroidetes bacterium]|nr:NUDIX hydrolase [Bacteroidota bacterium]